MTTNEQLVQRFVDQELSAEERIQFVVALGRDHALREHVLELERLVLDVARIARPGVPDGFVMRVMERTRPSARSSETIWERLIDAFWAPRALRWNMASAVAVGCIALVAIGLRMAPAARLRTTPSKSATAVSATLETRPHMLVRLVVIRPGARLVQAAGDFNGWNPSLTPLEQTTNGAWTVTLPLEPGRYEYQFVVDGEQWIGDPFAAEQNDDGFGSRNAVLDVRPPPEAPL